MMLKVNDEYLDFTDLVEVEKQIKLFEDISTTDGDFSYAFELPKTLNNIRILGNPFPDNISKPVYQRIPAILMTDGGEETFKGYIRVEGLTNVIKCSFFAGNNNWFGLLSDPLRDLDWSEYDVELTESNISAAIFNTEGVVFPVLDNGALAYRGMEQLKVEDFVAGIFVKDVFRKVFNSHGIKIQGELLDDAKFNSSITLTSSKNQSDIDSRSTYARTFNSPVPNGVHTPIEFTDDSNFPFSDGSKNLFNTSTYRYTADIKMRVKVEVTMYGPTGVGVLAGTILQIRKNGTSVQSKIALDAGTFPVTFSKSVILNAGDYVDATGQAYGLITGPEIIQNATIKITPTYLYQTFGNVAVPDWTQQQYVSAILRVFGVIPSYDSTSKTLTLNLLDKLKNKTPIDISPYISATEVDYVEFVSSYGKNTTFSFQEIEASDDFKKKHFQVKSYSVGTIEVENEFLEDSVPALESEFTAPISYINPLFGMSMEKTDLIDLAEEMKVDFTAVTSGTMDRARFAVEDGIFAENMLARIENSTNPLYNGDWLVFAVGTGWVELYGIPFDTDATGEISVMLYEYNDSDNVFLLHFVKLYTVNKFSTFNSFRLEATDYETMAPAFFDVIDQGLQINSDFKFSSTFSEGDQISLIDQYFRLVSDILNDPVKLYCTCTLPYYLFSQMDFLSPVVIRTEESQNTYYLNRITGYKESYLESTVELIKLP